MMINLDRVIIILGNEFNRSAWEAAQEIGSRVQIEALQPRAMTCPGCKKQFLEEGDTVVCPVCHTVFTTEDEKAMRCRSCYGNLEFRICQTCNGDGHDGCDNIGGYWRCAYHHEHTFYARDFLNW